VRKTIARPASWRGRAGKPHGSRAKNGGVSGEEIFCPLAENLLSFLPEFPKIKHTKTSKIRLSKFYFPIL